MSLTPSIKAQAIAAAIYTSTGIPAQVIERTGQPPLVTFARENRIQIQNYLRQSMKKKSDVEIDVLPVVGPLILEKVIGPIALTACGLFLFGYLAGKMKN